MGDFILSLPKNKNELIFCVNAFVDVARKLERENKQCADILLIDIIL